VSSSSSVNATAVELAGASLDEGLVGVAAKHRPQTLLRDGHLHLGAQRELLAEAVALVPLDAGTQAAVGVPRLDDLVLGQRAEQAIEVPGRDADAAFDPLLEAVEPRRLGPWSSGQGRAAQVPVRRPRRRRPSRRLPRMT